MQPSNDGDQFAVVVSVAGEDVLAQIDVVDTQPYSLAQPYAGATQHQRERAQYRAPYTAAFVLRGCLHQVPARDLVRSRAVTAAALARDATQFLLFKRAMGMRYRRAEFVLRSFVLFLRDQYGEHPVSLKEAAARWVARIDRRMAITVGNEFGVVRQLCLFQRRSALRAHRGNWERDFAQRLRGDASVGQHRL